MRKRIHGEEGKEAEGVEEWGYLGRWAIIDLGKNQQQ